MPSKQNGFKYSVGQTLKLKPSLKSYSLECTDGSGCWVFMPHTCVAGIISSIIPDIRIVIQQGDEVVIPIGLLEDLS